MFNLVKYARSLQDTSSLALQLTSVSLDYISFLLPGHIHLNYITFITFIGSYKIKKAVFPYRNSSTCKLFQDIEEVTHFKLVYEYIFVIVSLLKLFLHHYLCIIISSFRKILLIYLFRT